MTPRERLRTWRGKRSLREAAELLGCDQSLLRKLELGEESRLPGLTLANSIKREVGIPTEDWDRLRLTEREAS